MTSTVLELTGVNKKAGLIGVEIEVEGNRLPNNDNTPQSFHNTWLITQDGSLRGESWEYVFREPLSYEDTEKALQKLENEYKTLNSTINDSVRAGIHVHVNVQDLTLKQLYTMFIVYYCLENVLVEWCGKDRVGNHFCLRACDAEYVLFAIQHAFTEGGRVGELASENIRYASMNVSSVFKYGSVEFRSLRSTRDWTRLLNWVKTLTYIKEAAFIFDSPKSVVEYISLHGPIEFANLVLKDKFYLFNTNAMADLIYSAMQNIQAVAISVDFNKHVVTTLRRDSTPRYKTEASKFALVDWRKHTNSLDAETPLAEALPALEPLPFREVATNGKRPFEDDEIDGDGEIEWFGRGFNRPARAIPIPDNAAIVGGRRNGLVSIPIEWQGVQQADQQRVNVEQQQQFSEQELLAIRQRTAKEQAWFNDIMQRASARINAGQQPEPNPPNPDVPNRF